MDKKLIFSYLTFGIIAINATSCFISVRDIQNSSANINAETVLTSVALENSGTNSRKYDVSSYSGNNETFGDGDTWEVTNVASDDNVFFIFSDDTAVQSPESEDDDLQYSYNEGKSQTVSITTSRSGNSVILFAANGIYSTPEVSEIWVVNSESKTLIWEQEK